MRFIDEKMCDVDMTEGLALAPQTEWINTIQKINEKNAKIVLYGTSHTGEEIAQLFTKYGLNFWCFCGRSPQKYPDGIMGKPVYSPDWLFAHQEECRVVIAATQPSYGEIKENLLVHHFPESQILPLFDLEDREREQQYIASNPVDWKQLVASTERIYHWNGHSLRYMYRDNGSKALCILFSAFPNASKYPQYSALRLLWRSRTDYNLLYILDDMVNIPGGGSYYLGKNGFWWGIEAIKELIHEIMRQSKSRITVASGSSKGGTAALMFGLSMDMDYVIMGEPQYRIGSYMMRYTAYRPSLAEMLGTNVITADQIAELDQIIPDMVYSAPQQKKTAFFLHYYDKSLLFSEQCYPLLQDLRRCGYRVLEEKCDNLLHAEIQYTYPTFLLDSLDKISIYEEL